MSSANPSVDGDGRVDGEAHRHRHGRGIGHGVVDVCLHFDRRAGVGSEHHFDGDNAAQIARLHHHGLVGVEPRDIRGQPRIRKGALMMSKAAWVWSLRAAAADAPLPPKFTLNTVPVSVRPAPAVYVVF